MAEHVHKDEYGRPMTEMVTVTLTRSDWWMIRNQMSNMSDVWAKDNQPFMASRCKVIAETVAHLVLGPPEETVQPPVLEENRYTMSEVVDAVLERLEGRLRQLRV